MHITPEPTITNNMVLGDGLYASKFKFPADDPLLQWLRNLGQNWL